MSSIVWQYFTISYEDNSIAVCNICGAKLKKENSKSKSYTTSFMHDHSKTQHSESYKKFQSKSLDKIEVVLHLNLRRKENLKLSGKLALVIISL